MANTTSQHILGTSANLLGFCLFVITSLHIADQVETRLIDGLTSVVGVLLTVSCIFSFVSIRTRREERERRMEAIADYFFVVALLGILAIIVLIAFNFL
ncbi:MAG TPA: hypothetical protein DHW15_09935 [Bacteroidetes bacterium]|jgi:uncharacterized membrane protein HdeD (DUF308 family)|nr:MAG: hypothetical protein ABR94_03305 [Sphingobacteriales bacterium BACL12 MAG-120802-bin5]KRP13394.1 MAG: hypothetical protein ABR95_12885 [Sphingobacteriales bacterium BACL12 MAG-120813-bin55]HCK22460.1 hypothetical protein [Bacteroidota bacterium]